MSINQRRTPRPTDTLTFTNLGEEFYTTVEDFVNSSDIIGAESITYSNAQALVSSSELVPGKLYTITNATAANGGTGTVTVQAISTTQFSRNGTWIRPIAQKAFGYVLITTMGVGDTIDSIEVNGVEVLNNPVTWDTDLQTTIDLITAEISGGSYTAFRAGSAVVLVNTTAGSTPNGHTVVSAGSGTYAATDQDIRGGASGTDWYLSVQYDFTTNNIVEAYDLVRDVLIKGNAASIYAFPWGEKLADDTTPMFRRGTFEQCGILNWYFYGGAILDFYIHAGSFSSCVWDTVLSQTVRINGISTLNSLMFNSTISYSDCVAITFLDSTVLNSQIVNSNTLVDITFSGVCETIAIQTSVMNSCTLAGDTNYISTSTITELRLGSGISNSWFRSATIRNLNLSTVTASDLYYDTAYITPDEFEFYLEYEFDGTAGSGAVGALDVKAYIPDNFFAYQSISDGSGLTSAGAATMTVGIGTDDADAFMPATAYTDLNAVKTNTIATTKATAIRPVVAAVGTANITAGSIKVWIKGYIGV
jgi:hypothetical protein